MKIYRSLYFDYQATTPVNEQVLEKMLPYFREKAGNPHSSSHSVGWQTLHAVEEATRNIAILIGADTDEIIFTSGATEANNLALLGLGKSGSKGIRKRILVSDIEHKCVLSASKFLEEKYGYQVDRLPVDKEGFVSKITLEDAIDSDVLLVSIMAVNNEIGTIQNITELSSVAANAGALLHCDAAQAPIAMELKNIVDNVDLLSLSAHKMYGPQGIGVLFIRRSLQDRIEPILHGGNQQNGLRSGTLPAPLCVGMGQAALMLLESGEAERRILCSRRDRFVQLLHDMKWDITLNGPKQRDRHPGNANIMFHGFTAHDILNVLQPRLAASTGSACTSGIPEPSHVLRAIGLNNDEAESSVRFSLGFDTDEGEIEEAVDLINDALNKICRRPHTASL